jgi:hypothetical protein
MDQARRSGSLKRCAKHYWFEYDETQGGCQLCEREALKARSGDAASGAVIDVEPVGLTDPAPPELQPAEPVGLSQVPLGGTDSSRERPVEPATRAAAPLRSPRHRSSYGRRPVDDEDTRILNRLTQLRENGSSRWCWSASMPGARPGSSTA